MWEKRACPGVLDYGACARIPGTAYADVLPGAGISGTASAALPGAPRDVHQLFGYPPGSGTFAPGEHCLGGIFCMAAGTYAAVDGFSDAFAG